MANAAQVGNDQYRWLTCRVNKGMFSHELVVTYPAEGEKQKSVFVPGEQRRR